MHSASGLIRRALGWVRAHVQLIVGVVVTVASLHYLWGQIDLGELWESFRQGEYWYLLPALLLLVGISYARAMRWHILVGDEPNLGVRRLYHIVNIGYLFNNVLPAKAGEVARAYLVGRVTAGGVGKAASTLVVERMLDVLTLVILLLTLMPFVALPTWLRSGGLAFGIVALVGVAIMIVLSRYGSRGLEALWRYVCRVPLVGSPKLKRALASLLQGFSVLTAGQTLASVAFWSILIWFAYAVFNYALMRVFRLSLPFSAAATVLCATGFSMVVPSSPGAVGPFEAAAVLALSVFGLAESPSTAYAFGLHGFTNISLIVLGLIGLRREGVSFAHLRSGTTRASADTAP